MIKEESVCCRSMHGNRGVARESDLELTEMTSGGVLAVIKGGAAEGALLAPETASPMVPGVAADRVDGAGDSFNVGFLNSHPRGDDSFECARGGIASAALSTLRHGGVEAFRDSSLRNKFLREHSPAFSQGSAR